MSLDWIIVGGGIHGVHLAVRLLAETDVRPERVRIVDPGEQLLARWRTCTASTGMTHLRSPAVHHLDVSPWSLRRFAGRRGRAKRGLFAPPYDRPSLSLFNAHCDELVQAYVLAELHVQARVVACRVGCDSVGVGLSGPCESGLRELEAQNVVLAIGAGGAPRWPDWAPVGHTRLHHIFEPGFEGWPSSPETVAVVGSGISGVQVALRLHAEGHRVHLVSRHELRQHQFDSDPGWLGPREMAGFGREPDPARRRDLITAARHRGSVPRDIGRKLRRRISRGQIAWHGAEVLAFETRDGGGSGGGGRTGGIELHLATGSTLSLDRVLLATGFDAHRPGGSMVDALIESASLPCAQCGYPIVDSNLRWHPRIHVSGPLAELEIGPVSRNIAGARRAGDRIVAAAQAAQRETGRCTHHPVPPGVQS